MPREAPGPSEHHLEGFSGGAGDDSVCCWGAGQRALASVALDFHARHWVPLFCYRSALKYPAFGHSVLKITSVGAVLFYLFIRELRGAAVKCSSSHLVAGWLLALCLTESPLYISEPDRHCSKQGENAFWQVVLCPSNSGSCSDRAVLCHCRHGSRLLPRTFRYPGSRSWCGISGTGPVHPSRASPSHTPCLYCCLG